MKKVLVVLVAMFLLSMGTVMFTACGGDGSIGGGQSNVEVLEYELNADQESYSVVDIGSVTSGDVVIPETYNDHVDPFRLGS